MGFNLKNVVHRYTTKQPGITEQPHVGGIIASKLKANTPEFSRAKRLKRSLPEKEPVICVTIEDEMTVDDPAIRQERKAKSPQVSYKFKYALPLHLSCLPSMSLNEVHLTIHYYKIANKNQTSHVQS